MNVLLLLLVTLLSVLPAYAGCDDVVWDQQHVLSLHDDAQLQNEAERLHALGAQVHILTLDVGEYSLESSVLQLQELCPAWIQPNTNGDRNQYLLLFAVDTKHHKSGLYYGGVWASALEHRYHDILTDYMNPHFKLREWESGFAEGIRAAAAYIKSDVDSSHTIATDDIPKPKPPSSPFPWHLVLLIFGTVVAVILTGLAIALTVIRQQRRNKALSTAQTARDTASSILDAVKAKKRADEAAGVKWTPQRSNRLDQCFVDFARMQSLDDTKDDLAALSALALSYTRIARRANDLRNEDVEVKSAGFTRRHNDPLPPVDAVPTPASTPTVQPSAPVSTTTVINNDSSNDGLLTGLIVGEALQSHRRDEEDDDRPISSDSGYRRDSDDESSSGGSSSFGGDSSGGGSSDWSFGSDSGGGSSDFSSGDSGGGSSDF